MVGKGQEGGGRRQREEHGQAWGTGLHRRLRGAYVVWGGWRGRGGAGGKPVSSHRPDEPECPVSIWKPLEASR